MGGVEVPQAPREMERGEGRVSPSPLEEASRGHSPLPGKFFIFFVVNTYFDAC